MAEKRKRKLKKGYRILRGFYIFVVIVAAVIVLGYGASKVLIKPPTIPTADSSQSQTEQGVPPDMEKGDHQRKEQTYTFLLTCPDQSSGNADAVMVVTYDVPNQKIGMLSIPRDTLVNEPNPKINASYHKGVDNLKRVVSDLVGFPLDFHIVLDLDGFIELVDAVGGVEFNVPVNMYYDDPSQNLQIYYEPGMQHLDGQSAMEVCRFRKNADGTGYPLGDIQRAETLRNMMTTVAKKVVSWSSITKVNQFIDILERNVETNLSSTDFAWFASQALKLNLDTGVVGGSLPGDGTITYKGTKWCYELYQDESLKMINELVNPYTSALTEKDIDIFTPNKLSAPSTTN